jgi:hypothetical protein
VVIISICKNTTLRAAERRRNSRAVSPLKRDIPKPYGYEEDTSNEVELDGLLAVAEEIQLTFTSPTTPPPSERFIPMDKCKQIVIACH